MGTRSALAVAVCVLGLAGCGGGTKTIIQSRTTTQTETGPPPTKAEFIARADAICDQYGPQRDRLNKQLSQYTEGVSRTQANQAAEVLRNTADVLRQEFLAIRQLPEPPADASVIDSYLSSAETTISDVDKLAAAVADYDVTRIKSVSGEMTTDGSKTQGIADGYGFKVCGHD
jgi:hypothetical protein